MDPWIAYTKPANRPVRLRRDRALWRDSHSLIQALAERHQRAPGYENILARLNRTASLSVFGVDANKNDVRLWRHERLPLPLRYLAEVELLQELKDAVELAEKVGSLLKEHLTLLAQYVLIPDWDQLSDADRKKQRNAIRKRTQGKSSKLDHFLETLNCERPYWVRLDLPFRRLVVDLADPRHSNKEHIPISEWATAVRNAACDAFDNATRAMETSARGLRAAAEARARFKGRVSKDVSRYVHSQEKEETV
jgi:hypothetical protein